MDAVDQRLPARLSQPKQHDSAMRAWFETTKVGKVQVLSDEEAIVDLGGRPNSGVLSPGQSLARRGVNIVPKFCEDFGEIGGQILVELDLHNHTGTPGAGRSS